MHDKMVTQTVKGGNTAEIYKGGTLPKSQMIVRLHPDVCRLAWRFGREHHYADYSLFKNNKLILKKDAVVPTGIDDYGMRLVSAATGEPIP